MRRLELQTELFLDGAVERWAGDLWRCIIRTHVSLMSKPALDAVLFHHRAADRIRARTLAKSASEPLRPAPLPPPCSCAR